MNLTYEQIEVIYAKKGYKFFKGEFNINVGFIRMDDIFTNKYTDIAFIAYQEKGKDVLKVYRASTKAGRFYEQNPKNVAGATGVAVALEGQLKMLFVDLIDGVYNFHKSAHLAQSIENISVYRDANKNGVIDRDSIIQTDGNEITFGINCHWASGVTIENWSAGCLVVPVPDYWGWIDIIRRSSKIYGNKVTRTLLHAKDCF